MIQSTEVEILIAAPISAVWEALTSLKLMGMWMGDREMDIQVLAEWKTGSPIVIRGFHHTWFENKGTVIEVQRNKVLAYNYLSSISKIPDIPEHYTNLEFRLTSLKQQTSLVLKITNFPTESIFKHVDFYWRGTLPILKKFVEEQSFYINM